MLVVKPVRRRAHTLHLLPATCRAVMDSRKRKNSDVDQQRKRRAVGPHGTPVVSVGGTDIAALLQQAAQVAAAGGDQTRTVDLLQQALHHLGGADAAASAGPVAGVGSPGGHVDPTSPEGLAAQDLLRLRETPGDVVRQSAFALQHANEMLAVAGSTLRVPPDPTRRWHVYATKDAVPEFVLGTEVGPDFRYIFLRSAPLPLYPVYPVCAYGLDSTLEESLHPHKAPEDHPLTRDAVEPYNQYLERLVYQLANERPPSPPAVSAAEPAMPGASAAPSAMSAAATVAGPSPEVVLGDADAVMDKVRRTAVWLRGWCQRVLERHPSDNTNYDTIGQVLGEAALLLFNEQSMDLWGELNARLSSVTPVPVYIKPTREGDFDFAYQAGNDSAGRTWLASSQPLFTSSSSAGHWLRQKLGYAGSKVIVIEPNAYSIGTLDPALLRVDGRQAGDIYERFILIIQHYAALGMCVPPEPDDEDQDEEEEEAWCFKRSDIDKSKFERIMATAYGVPLGQSELWGNFLTFAVHAAGQKRLAAAAMAESSDDDLSDIEPLSVHVARKQAEAAARVKQRAAAMAESSGDESDNEPLNVHVARKQAEAAARMKQRAAAMVDSSDDVDTSDDEGGAAAAAASDPVATAAAWFRGWCERVAQHPEAKNFEDDSLDIVGTALSMEDHLRYIGGTDEDPEDLVAKGLAEELSFELSKVTPVPVRVTGVMEGAFTIPAQDFGDGWEDNPMPVLAGFEPGRDRSTGEVSLVWIQINADAVGKLPPNELTVDNRRARDIYERFILIVQHYAVLGMCVNPKEVDEEDEYEDGEDDGSPRMYEAYEDFDSARFGRLMREFYGVGGDVGVETLIWEKFWE